MGATTEISWRGSEVTWSIRHGDIVDMLRDEPANSFDAVLCDPPYGLSFMGRKWDYEVPGVALWEAVLRVCKPGAPLIAFSGTRTYHRTVVAIEDAGFEIRDCLAWMYGSGFPKSLDVSKAIDARAGDARPVVSERVTGWSGTLGGGAALSGLTAPDVRRVTSAASAASAAWNGYGTALKPAFEPACLARKPLEGTVAANVERWGVGALAIDACRIGTSKRVPSSAAKDRVGQVAKGDERRRTVDASGFDPNVGRWPANVLLDPEAAASLDEQSGNRPGMSGGGAHAPDYAGGMFGAIDSTGTARGDNGGASRFFYVAKASREERELGCDGLALRSAADVTGSQEGAARLDSLRTGAGRTSGARWHPTDSPRTGAGRTSGARNHHPTVKPIELCRYLARLIRPPVPRRILVPFSGSGSEMIGCLLEGWPEVVGIEREADFIEIARARLALAASNPRAFEPFAERGSGPVDDRQLALLGGVK